MLGRYRFTSRSTSGVPRSKGISLILASARIHARAPQADLGITASVTAAAEAAVVEGAFVAW